jgi:hypothetical protein
MKKVTRLTERDLTRLVKRVIKEDEDTYYSYEEKLKDIKNDLDDMVDNLYDIENDIDRDDDLTNDEKEDLLYFIGNLLDRCEKKKKR